MAVVVRPRCSSRHASRMMRMSKSINPQDGLNLPIHKAKIGKKTVPHEEIQGIGCHGAGDRIGKECDRFTSAS